MQTNEGFYRDILDNIPDAVYLLEATGDGRFRNLQVNRSLEKITGYSKEQLIGMCQEDMVSQQSTHTINAMLHHCFTAGVMVEKDIEYDLPNGKRILYSKFIPVRNADGHVQRILGIIKDASDNKHYIHEMEYYRDVFEYAKWGIVIGNTDGTILERINQEFANMHGYTVEELTGRPIVDIFVPEYRKIFTSEFQLVHQQGHRSLESIHLRKDGTIFPALINITAILDQHKNIMHCIINVQDISERMRIEERLIASERQFRTLAENAPDIIMRYDRMCRRIYVNPAFEHELDMPKEVALNVTPYGQWPANVTMSVEEYISIMRHVMDTGETKLVVIGWPRHDEKGIEIQYYDVRIVAEYDSEGKVSGVLVMGHNITNLKIAQQHLEESHWQLRRLTDHLEVIREEERKRLARELHDEFGQLLTVIRMNISMLCMKDEYSNEEIKKDVERIVSLVDKTFKGVRNIAAMLRPEVLEMGIVAALEWLVDQFSMTTGISCILKIEKEKIELDEKSAIAIFRIAQESLTNVARHAKADKVNIIFSKELNGIRLRISDNGQGFDPGLKKENSLGLVGIRERAIMLGGEVNIISAKGKGAVIEIHVPILD